MVAVKKENARFVVVPAEYDKIEKELLHLTLPRDIYRDAARWIVSKLHPSFVLFLDDTAVDDENKSISKNQFFIKLKDCDCNIEQCIQERKNAAVKNDILFFHESGCLSFSYKVGNTSNGYLYVGQPSDSSAYTKTQAAALIPLVRILNKALLYCEASTTKAELNRLHDAFSHYVSPDIVEDSLHNPDVIRPGGEKKFLTCLFTDLRGFTELSDGMDPIQLVRVLNLYLNEMSQVIIALGGTIDKFEGDAIMAFFGAPHSLEDHAVRCCLAAIRMKRMEAVLNEQLIHENLIKKPLFTRIGINSGDMVVGNIGSLQRLDYTVIGGNVNIASRLENANKEFSTAILISGATYDIVKAYFECSSLGYVSLRGISKPIEVYQLLGLQEGINLEYDNFVGAMNVETGEEMLEDAKLEDAEDVEDADAMLDEAELQEI
ncbi:MAG: adenylate/guanylate cyclase domain-containing protein [Treponema sp.]|nr:adenylate/guanylate cyclase domain-containing protein [Treponema sp.]